MGRDLTKAPYHAYYDWVEVYNYDTETKQFTLEWRDDFNTLDYTKWTP